MTVLAFLWAGLQDAQTNFLELKIWKTRAAIKYWNYYPEAFEDIPKVTLMQFGASFFKHEWQMINYICEFSRKSPA